jgi:hypothetical protein
LGIGEKIYHKDRKDRKEKTGRAWGMRGKWAWLSRGKRSEPPADSKF